MATTYSFINSLNSSTVIESYWDLTCFDIYLSLSLLITDIVFKVIAKVTLEFTHSNLEFSFVINFVERLKAMIVIGKE